MLCADSTWPKAPRTVADPSVGKIACREPLFGLGVAQPPRRHSNKKDSSEQRQARGSNGPEEKRRNYMRD